MIPAMAGRVHRTVRTDTLRFRRGLRAAENRAGADNCQVLRHGFKAWTDALSEHIIIMAIHRDNKVVLVYCHDSVFVCFL